MTLPNINRDSPITVIKQIAANLIVSIEKGFYKKGDRLLSINSCSKQNNVSRDTVERAYKKVIEKGYVTAVKGKGFYVAGVPEIAVRVLFVLNAMDTLQKAVYESIIKSFGEKAKVDIYTCQNYVGRFNEIIETNLGKYHYFIVSPDISNKAIEKSLDNM